MSRQKLLLGVLGVLLLAVVWRLVGGGDDAPTGPPTGGLAARSHAADEEGAPVAAPVPASRGREKAPPTKDVHDLRLARLEDPPHSFSPGRDPWHFYEPPPPPPIKPKPPSQEELERMRLLAEERARQQREAEEKARYIREHTPPPFTMSFLGTFGPPNRRYAVFNDGKTIYNVREGERIAGNFVLAHLGYESVDVSYTLLPEAPPQRVAVGAGKAGAPGVGVPPR
jgi:hypothetical protein